MPRVIRTILRQANTIYDLANATAKMVTSKPTAAIVNDYVLTQGDVGKFINVTATAGSALGSNVFLPSSVFSEGQLVRVYNSSITATLRVVPNSSVTLHTAATNISSTFVASNTIIGAGATGNWFTGRNVAPQGIATIMCVAANTFVIHGPGVSSQFG